MIKTVLSFSSALFLLAGMAGANAASIPAGNTGPVAQNSQAMAAADQIPAMNVRQQLQDQLTKAGFTDVVVVPSSFYIHAENKKGEPVAMVVGPDGFTEVTEVPAKPASTSDTASPASGASTPKK